MLTFDHAQAELVLNWIPKCHRLLLDVFFMLKMNLGNGSEFELLTDEQMGVTGAGKTKRDLSIYRNTVQKSMYSFQTKYPEPSFW